MDEEFRELLMEKLKIPNPKWLENERMGRWNRGVPKILRFYDTAGKKGLWIPRGYIRQLILLARKQNLEYTIDDRRRLLPSIALNFYGRLKPFQHDAVETMGAKEFGTLSAPTGCGKTVIALQMIAKRAQPAIVVVHTKDLAFQWVDRINEFLRIPKSDVGIIGAGKKRVGNQITVALVQSLYKCAEEISEYFGHIVVDECHRTPSRTFTEAVSEFDCKYMLGLSATPWRRDRLSKLIFWHLGDVHHEIDRSKMVAFGHILQAEVIERVTTFKPYYDPVNEYSKMLSELTSDDDRNMLIAADVSGVSSENTGICLVLSDRKKHCETIQFLLKYKFGVEAELLTGDLSTAQRQQVIDRLNLGEVKVLVATGQLIGEGFDCSDLSTLFLSTPIRFSGRLLQYLGRILRPGEKAKRARVYDYIDIHVDVLKTAADARKKVYQQ
ncbi:MAG: DEAD/DEAH box helicase [Desulfobacteraceae bacterium]|nr:DEAD/DEAH box helicase [Desulfobacteraceae bacterium]